LLIAFNSSRQFFFGLIGGANVASNTDPI